MARKSKDFKELMQEKQNSQNQQKNMQAVIQKIQEERIFGELDLKIAIERKGVEKMSDVIKQFIAPYFDTIPNLSQYQSLFTLGVVAWNASLMSESEQEEIVETFLKQSLTTDDPRIQQQTREFIAELIARKHQHFYSIQRLVINFEIRKEGRRYDISVASTQLKTD